MQLRQAADEFIRYLRVERNASPQTIRSYAVDLESFLTYVTPPNEPTLAFSAIDHRVIREFIGWLHDRGLQKTSIARRIAALRAFFKYCIRRNLAKNNPARIVTAPRLPKRVPRVPSAEELGTFLDGLVPGKGRVKRKAPSPMELEETRLVLKRDRAVLELLYASGLRVSELVGLDVGNLDRRGQMLRVLGKGALKVSCAAESGRKPRGRFSQPDGGASFGAIGGGNRKKIRPAIQLESGSASTCLSPRLCHSPAGRWRGLARHPRAARACFAFENATLHAGQHRTFDECLRQGSPARVNRSIPCLVQPKFGKSSASLRL